LEPDSRVILEALESWKLELRMYSLHKGLLLAMSHVYVGNLDDIVFKQELEDEFQTYRVIRRIWIARKPPDYAFIDFDDHRDAQNAIRDLDGKHNWRVELSHYSRGGSDCSGHVYGFGEFGSGNDRRFSRTHPSDHSSPGEHLYLSTSLA